MLNIVKPGVVLMLITVVAVALLGIIKEVTRKPIEENNLRAKNEAMQKVMPDPLKAYDFGEAALVGTDGVAEYSIAKIHGRPVAAAIVAEANGYGGAVKIMLGVGAEGEITGLKLIEHNETPGLGANADKKEFYDKFIGKSGRLSVTKSAPGASEIVAMTSATITTQAVTDAVNTALDFFERELKGEFQ